MDYITKLPTELKEEFCARLDCVSLSRLAQTSWFWSEFTQYQLYHQDAVEHNSSAILWASRGSSGASIEVERTVLHRALQHGGDVNATHYDPGEQEHATALHLAAALGREHRAGPAAEWS